MRARYPDDTTSDQELIEAARTGDSEAIGSLWERHASAGRRYARTVTSSFEADDLVSEAFASILSAIKNGHGPRGLFRPYLFTSIRSVAAQWGGKNRDVPLEHVNELVESTGHTDGTSPETDALVETFQQLPERWRTILWYLHVEDMKPREIAPLMDLTPNAVSALAVRARRGFKTAWIDVARRHSGWSRDLNPAESRSGSDDEGAEAEV